MPTITVMISPDGSDGADGANARVRLELASPQRAAMVSPLVLAGLSLGLLVLYAAYQAYQTTAPAPLRRLAYSATDGTAPQPAALSPSSVDECLVDITAVTRDEDLPPARGGVAS